MFILFKFKKTLKSIKNICYKKQKCCFYRYDDAVEIPSENFDTHITVYSSYAAIPLNYRVVTVPSSWRSKAYYRLKNGTAKLLCYSENGISLDAYGWICDLSIFRHQFGLLAHTGTMLGFYWTCPSARGRGLYGKLLIHSLAIGSKKLPILIYTSPENIYSQRGIEKANFKPIGVFEFSLWFTFYGKLKKL